MWTIVVYLMAPAAMSPNETIISAMSFPTHEECVYNLPMAERAFLDLWVRNAAPVPAYMYRPDTRVRLDCALSMVVDPQDEPMRVK